MNIVKIESHGTVNLINLNAESYLYNELKKFFDFEQATLRHLKEEVSKSLPKVKSIVLFGSIANRTEKFNSDVDVLIITEDKAKAKGIIAKKQEIFSKKFGNMLSAYIITENEFRQKKNTALIRGILENHILIKGEKL